MKTIDQVLQENDFQVRNLLRRSHIIGAPGMETIQRGFNKHGEPFMMKLLNIIVPENSNFTELIQPKIALLDSTAINTSTLMPMNTTAATTGTTGKVWTFWEKLLNAVGSTGETIGQVKQDIAGNPTDKVYTAEQIAVQDGTRKMLYMAAAALVAIIIILLIVRK